MLSKLNIRAKMFLILLTTFIAIFIFSFIFFNTVRGVEDYTHIEINVEKLKNSMLMLRRHEKDFLLRDNLTYKKKFLQEYQRSLTLAKKLDKQLLKYDYPNTEIKDYLHDLNLYKINFLNLVEAMQIRGLNENDGLYGSLRNSIHEVQNYAKVLNSMPLLAKIYELRKNEKDFMLRKNLLYRDKFLENFKNLNIKLLDKNMQKYLFDYRKEFLNLVNKEVICGLNENLGLEGELRNHVHKTEDLLKMLENNIISYELKEKDIMFNSMYFVAMISILIVIILILIISNNILNSLSVFQKGLLDFFDYLNKKKKSIFSIELQQKDEFGDMADLINKQIFKTSKFLKDEKDKLDKLASIDHLTGIYNRYKFNELFELKISELIRYDKKFSIILIDLDDFKKINDTYGHIIGDVVLKKFVDITKANLRNVDIFARWGGEEFIILLPNIGLDNTFIVSEKIRKATQEYKNDLFGSFTISLGIASAQRDDTLETLTNKADVALYKAKASGKNKTIKYEENK